MSKELIVLFIGIMQLIIPRLGIPEIWKFYFFGISGVVLIVIGYSLRRAAYLRSIDSGDGERSTDSYVESTQHINWPTESGKRSGEHD